MSVSNWIRSVLYGYREVLANGQPVIQRDTLNFLGIQVLDDPVNKRTNVTFIGTYIPTADPIGDTIVARSPSGGTALTALSIYDDVAPMGVQSAWINGATGLMYSDNGFTFAPSSITLQMPYTPIYEEPDYGVDTYGRVITFNPLASVIFDLDVPDDVSLTSVSVHIQPALGHVGLPGTMPSIFVAEVDTQTANTVLLVVFTDDSVDVATYETAHAITVNALTVGSALPVTTLRGRFRYIVKFVSEDGVNALPAATILGVSVTYTTNTYRV